jgi:hypothetical protein
MFLLDIWCKTEVRLKDNLDKLNINPDSYLQNDDEDVPPWTYNSPKININLSNIKKSSNSPVQFKELRKNMKILYIFIWTVQKKVVK